MSKIRKGLDDRGKFAKGNKFGKGNNKSRNKLAPMKALKTLQEAVKRVEKEKTEELGEPFSLYDEFVRQALTEKTIFIALMKKLAPDLSQVTLGEEGIVSISFNIKDFRGEDKEASGKIKVK